MTGGQEPLHGEERDGALGLQSLVLYVEGGVQIQAGSAVGLAEEKGKKEKKKGKKQALQRK